MNISRVCTAAALAATLVLGTTGAAMAATPQQAAVAIGITGPRGLQVDGAWGTWTIQAKNPSAVKDTTDRLQFAVSGGDDPRQFQFQIRSGTTGAWTSVPVQWTEMSTNPALRLFAGYFDFLKGGTLDLAAHSVRTFQVRARQVATSAETDPFDSSFEAILTPTANVLWGGARTAQASSGVAPEGLTTTITGLPTNIPADGKTRLFQIHIATANHADWNIPNAGFFIWQGQKYGTMNGPKACDAEVDVLDPTTHRWHRVGLEAAGLNQESVDLLHWATGPGYDRTVTARITLGAGFNAQAGQSSLSFGYFPGSGAPDYFWTGQKLTSNHVKGARTCV